MQLKNKAHFLNIDVIIIIFYLQNCILSTVLVLALKDQKNLQNGDLAKLSPSFPFYFILNTSLLPSHTKNRTFLGFKINVTGLSGTPALSLAQKNQRQTANSFYPAAWTSPGKPI